MKKPALVIAAVAALIVAAAVAFRFTAPPPSATPNEDAGVTAAEVPDAATAVIDAGAAARAPREWKLNPHVFSDRGTDFYTLQDAINSAEGGQVLTLPSGVYVQTGPLVIQDKSKLSLVARDGPAYVLFFDVEPGAAALEIKQSSEITLEGLVLERGDDEQQPLAIVRAQDSSKVQFRRFAAADGNVCINLERTEDVTLENVLVGPCLKAAIRSHDGRGRLLVWGARLFASERALTVSQSDATSAPAEVEIVSTAATSAFGFDNFSGKVLLNGSIVSGRRRDELEAMQPFFKVSNVELTESEDPPSDALKARFAAGAAQGKSMLVAINPAPSPEQLGDCPGTDFSWGLTPEDRTAAAALVASDLPDDAEAAVPEGPIIVGEHLSFPLCGVGEKLKIYSGADLTSDVTKELETCDALANEIATFPEVFTLVSVSKSWVQVRGTDGKEGYVLANDLHAAEEMDLGATRIPMPGYKCERGFSPAKDSILVKCAADACSGETCRYEEEGQITESGDPHVVLTDHEIPLPEGAKVSKTDVITKNFIALCCT